MSQRFACGLHLEPAQVNFLVFFEKLVLPNILFPIDEDEFLPLIISNLLVSEKDLKIDKEYQGIDIEYGKNGFARLGNTIVRPGLPGIAHIVPPGHSVSIGYEKYEKFLFAKHFSEFLYNCGIIAPSIYNEAEFMADYHKGNHSCLSIVMRNIPIIDIDKVDIKEFISFLKDEKTIKLRHRLFNWINEVDRQNLKAHEVQELISTRLDDYKTWIVNSKLKHEVSTFESILTLGAEMIEKLLRLKPSKAIKALFDFRKRNLEINISELQAPGRELALIQYAKDKFG
jgi:hypothetical protein